MTREPLDAADALGEAVTGEEQAATLVVHGLLEFQAKNDAAAREARVLRVMGALDEAAAPAPLRRNPWRFSRVAAAIAAVFLLGFIALQLGLPTEKSALAQVQLSIDAMKAAGAQRYEVRVLSWAEGDRDDEPDIIDTRPSGLVVVQHHPPWEKERITVGRDDTGLWAIGDDGSVVRGEEAARMWPPWAAIDGEIVLGQSIDGVLAAMVSAYTLHVSPAEELERAGLSRVMNRISATRIAAAGHQPNHIELWIDPTSLVVERIVYSWDKEARDDPGPGGGGGPGGPGGPPPGPRPDGPGAGRDGSRPPPPPPGGRPGGSGRRGGPPPGGPGGRPGNPRLIIFERVETPSLSDSWFDPATHAGKK